MAIYTLVKSAGAPSGTIRFVTADGAFTITDAGTITTSDIQVAYELRDSPFLTLQGIDDSGDAQVPAPSVDNVGFVDGLLSYYEDGTWHTITTSGGGSPSGAAGGVLSGSYPNPGFATPVAAAADLTAETNSRIAGDAALQSQVDSLEAATGFDPSTLGVFPVEDFGNVLTAPVAAYQAAYAAAVADGGGIIQFPDGTFTAEKQSYLASGWGSAFAISNSNIYVRGAGEGATTLISNYTGAGTVIDILGYSAAATLAAWNTNRFPSLTLYALNPANSYAQGDQTFTFNTAGAAANFAVGDPVMLVTGQVDVVSPAGRGLQPDSVYGVVQSVNTGANTITLTEGIPKPLAPQYFVDGTSSVASTLTSSAFQAPFGIYNLKNRMVKNVGVSDMTLVCAATSRPALAAHAATDGKVERVTMRSASGGGLATFVCQEISRFKFEDITMDTWGSVGYWGVAMCTDDVKIRNIRHTHRTDVAYALLNEGHSRVTIENVEQISAKTATTGLPSFGMGISYDCHVDGLLIHNAGPAAALQILQNQPAPYVGGEGVIDNVTIRGNVANPGYIRGNWTVKRVPSAIKLYGPPDNPTTAASAAVPSNNSTRKPKQIQVISGWFPYNQAGGRVYIGRIPALSYIWPAEVSVTTAFSAGALLSVSVHDPASGLDFDHQLAANVDVTTVGTKVTTANSGNYVQTAAIDYEVYVNLKAGVPTPTQGMAFVSIRWVPMERLV